MSIKFPENYKDDIIDRLILSNMHFGDNHPYDLHLNFGVYRLTFNGTSKSSISDACGYFKEQISKIVDEWDDNK